MASNQAPIVDRIRIIPRPDDFLDRNVGNSGEVFFDKQSNTLRLYSGNDAGGFSVITNSNITEHLIDSGVGVVEYTVTVGVDPDGLEAGNKYFIDGVYKPTLTFVQGFTYIFNQNDSTNEFFPNPTGSTANIHPLNFSSDNVDGERAGGTTYLTKVIYKINNDPVNKQTYFDKFAAASQRSVQITVTAATPSTLYYWCTSHNGMGNEIATAAPGSGAGDTSISVSETVPESPTNGSIWFDSSTAKLFVYVEDEDSNQWVQPVYPVINTLTDLGIVDGTIGQVLTTDGEGNFTFEDAAGGDGIGNFTLSNSVIDTDDSSGITFTPPVTTSSDLTVENDLSVRNTAYANNFVTTSAGTPKIDSATTINLSSQDGTIVSGGPFRLPSLTNTQRDALVPANGDMIYNTTNNRPEMYVNGAWKIVDTSPIV